MKVKIGICQMNVVDNKNTNLNNAKKLIIKAVKLGAKIVCLPEMFNCLYENNSFINNAEEQGGKTYQYLSNTAKELAVYLVGGSISEKCDNHLYNTSYVFNPKGELIAKHRKVHLFDIEVKDKIHFKESDTFTAGNKFTIFNTEYGTFGLAICFDIRFVEQFRVMALQGAKAIFVPGAFNMTTGPAHWHLSFRARAVDNQLYMIGCAPARNTKSTYVSFGNSLVTNPWGEVEVALDEKQNVVVTEIDFSNVDEIRKQLPILKNRRTDLYDIKIHS
ncbi:carbon-nitrogen hydrolase family protein [Clostridium sp. 'deep sea']|uniref:carbon-nitrogen hydrolase family protein n=1 Tax=Clostridium sp. 'deep sea' TaxID=2779445 RepID=UPI0018964CEC|nr:carbon-nitrogen hydrolase family protein [Clostridium sp. 'deep sea']QOR35987.1 carbon-nitrogen hydrolase family protein [Clostridium sp. 'deep sea']